MEGHFKQSKTPEAKAFGKNPKTIGFQGLRRSPGLSRHLGGNN